MAPNKVDIQVLREVTNRIFDFIESKLEMKSVEMPRDLYWSIHGDQLYDMSREPSDIICGSLADDYEFIVSSYKSSGNAIPLDLMHVAPVLNALAKAVPSFEPPSKKGAD
jgi:hypothetical protein